MSDFSPTSRHPAAETVRPLGSSPKLFAARLSLCHQPRPFSRRHPAQHYKGSETSPHLYKSIVHHEESDASLIWRGWGYLVWELDTIFSVKMPRTRDKYDKKMRWMLRLCGIWVNLTKKCSCNPPWQMQIGQTGVGHKLPPDYLHWMAYSEARRGYQDVLAKHSILKLEIVQGCVSEIWLLFSPSSLVRHRSHSTAKPGVLPMTRDSSPGLSCNSCNQWLTGLSTAQIKYMLRVDNCRTA